jgi:hypothetical protein
MRVLVYRLEAATSGGIDTAGALPNVPVAVTTLLEETTGPVATGDAEPEAEEDGAVEDVDDRKTTASRLTTAKTMTKRSRRRQRRLAGG